MKQLLAALTLGSVLTAAGAYAQSAKPPQPNASPQTNSTAPMTTSPTSSSGGSAGSANAPGPEASPGASKAAMRQAMKACVSRHSADSDGTSKQQIRKACKQEIKSSEAANPQ